MNNNLQELQDLYRTEIGSAALTYLEIGLALFHGFEPDDFGSRNIEIKRGFHPHPQTALGNLAIAVELMLKAFVASKHLSLLFKDSRDLKDLSLEIRTILTCPDSLPPEFNWRSFDIDLRSSYSIGFDECISLFCLFCPEKRWLESDMKLLKRARNTSLHAFLPAFQQYELEQAARVALEIHDILREAQIFGQSGYEHSYLDELFIDRFDEEKVLRVRCKIDESKKRSKTIDELSANRITHAFGDWDHFVVQCPFCKCDCVLTGDTELIPPFFSAFDGADRPSLLFRAGSLKCSHCGLALNDSGELRLAGVDLSYSRSDELDLYMSHKGNKSREVGE